MESKVDISGLPKANVLLKLYDNAICAGKNFHNRSLLTCSIQLSSKQGKIELAQAKLGKQNLYFDYIDLGADDRPLKVDLSGESFNPAQYDEYNGYAGYARTLILQLREELYPARKHVSEQQQTTFDMFHVLNNQRIERTMTKFIEQMACESSSSSEDAVIETHQEQDSVKKREANIAFFKPNSTPASTTTMDEPAFGPLRSGYRFPT